MVITVTDDMGEDSVEVVIVVPSVVATIIIVGVGVVGLRGAALPLVVLVLSVAMALGSSTSSGRAFVFQRFKGAFLLRLFLLSWSHGAGCTGRGRRR